VMFVQDVFLTKVMFHPVVFQWIECNLEEFRRNFCLYLLTSAFPILVSIFFLLLKFNFSKW
jgi:hypothetical protein